MRFLGAALFVPGRVCLALTLQAGDGVAGGVELSLGRVALGFDRGLLGYLLIESVARDLNRLLRQILQLRGDLGGGIGLLLGLAGRGILVRLLGTYSLETVEHCTLRIGEKLEDLGAGEKDRKSVVEGKSV